jgi:acyl carrier protein
MKSVTPEGAKRFLQEHLSEKIGATRAGKHVELVEDCDLLLSGIIDSIGLLELVGAIQEFLGQEIDFEALDPEQMTIVGPLCKFISEESGRRA